jgi:hypothetical protein
MPRSTAMAALAMAATLLAACAGERGPGAPQPDDPVNPSVTAAGPASLGSVTGLVTDAAGKPLSGVLVQVSSLDNPPRPVPEIAITTDAAGHYTWSLQPGKYQLDAGGAKTIVTVTAGASVQAADLKANG